MSSRKKQLFYGFLAIASVALVIVICWLGMFLPGLAGSFFTGLVGVFSTPFLLESAFFILGLITVMTVNHIRQKKEGPELVYLEEVNDPLSKDILPNRSRSTIYKDTPLEHEEGLDLAIIEGAIDNDDLDLATDRLMAMPPSQLEEIETIKLRLKLAQKRNDPLQVADLQKKMALREI